MNPVNSLTVVTYLPIGTWGWKTSCFELNGPKRPKKPINLETKYEDISKLHSES